MHPKLFLMSSYSNFQKYVTTPQARNKFKKQCLRRKNILFENEHIQLGCKVTPLYDFYSSQHYALINLFIGNKSSQPIQDFSLRLRGSANLKVWVEEKGREVREHTQHKERIIIGCTALEEEILLLMDFSCPAATLRAMPLPLNLLSMCVFNPPENIPAAIQTEGQLSEWLEHKYEYTQETRVGVRAGLFKKGAQAQISKYLERVSKVCDGVFWGVFSTTTLTQQHAILFKVTEDSMAVTLCGNDYSLFDALFANLKWLFE